MINQIKLQEKESRKSINDKRRQINQQSTKYINTKRMKNSQKEKLHILYRTVFEK